MRLIQVGMGGMGGAWLRAALNAPDYEYAAFVEISDRVARTQAARYGLDAVPVFPSLDKALNAVSADGLINVTPPPFHEAICVMALEAGLPVLSEKPLADTPAAARAIVDKANATGVLHMVAQNRRYDVGALTLKRLLDSGEMGRVTAVSVEFFRGARFTHWVNDMAYPLLIDMAIHHFDMMRYFLSADPVSLYARSWNPPWSWYKGDASASVLVNFDGGATVSYSASWCSMGVDTSWNAHWRFECERGAVVMRDDRVYVEKRRGPNAEQALMLVRPVEPVYTNQDYLLREFYDAVTDGRAPATACQDNIRSMAMVFDSILSAETGRVVHSGESLTL